MLLFCSGLLEPQALEEGGELLLQDLHHLDYLLVVLRHHHVILIVSKSCLVDPELVADLEDGDVGRVSVILEVPEDLLHPPDDLRGAEDGNLKNLTNQKPI